jgi:tetratricopeptide (TPR) repeat protein
MGVFQQPSREEFKIMTNQDSLYDEIVQHGASSETLRILLDALKKKDAPGKVLQECIKAVRLYPGDPFLRKMLAESYAEVGFLSQAEMELDKLTSQMGDLIQAYKLQAEIYEKQNRREEAIRSLRIYLAHRPEDHESLDLFEALHTPHRPLMGAPAPEIVETASVDWVQPPADEEPRLPEETVLPEIATSTLAEVYVNQGEIAEALGIYQKVLTRNPRDEKARERMEELKAMLPAEPAAPEKTQDLARKKKERAIAILEAWLTDLRRMYRESVTT